MTTMPTRVDGDLFEAAKSTGSIHSRSAAQQIAHWARIGREFESSAAVSQRDIEAVLAGERSYDLLHEREQAVVRAAWDEQIAADIAGLDFEKEFAAAGDTWVVGDGKGSAVTKSAAKKPAKRAAKKA